MSVSFEAWHGIDYTEVQIAVDEYRAQYSTPAATASEVTQDDLDLLITVGEAEVIMENEALRMRIAALEEEKRRLLSRHQ